MKTYQRDNDIEQTLQVVIAASCCTLPAVLRDISTGDVPYHPVFLLSDYLGTTVDEFFDTIVEKGIKFREGLLVIVEAWCLDSVGIIYGAEETSPQPIVPLACLSPTFSKSQLNNPNNDIAQPQVQYWFVGTNDTWVTSLVETFVVCCYCFGFSFLCRLLNYLPFIFVKPMWRSCLIHTFLQMGSRCYPHHAMIG